MGTPGLKLRKRANGTARYWVPPQKDVQAGYAPKSLAFAADLSDEEVAARCRSQWADLEAWRKGREEPTKRTIDWLINRYQTDRFSPYHKVSPATRANYDGCLRMLSQDFGDTVIGRRPDGSPTLTGADFREWYENRSAKPSQARHLLVQLRILFSYAVEIGVPAAAEIRQMLHVMRFPTVRPRTSAPTREQVYAIVEKAVEAGFLSIAITTLAQFELIERRVSIIGKWNGDQWTPGWLWEGVSPDWTITYEQNKKGVVRRECHLPTVQPLLALMQQIRKERRQGPVIVCEATGRPWQMRNYVARFREIARAAGVPDSVWSMDMRAGGATEADSVEHVTDRMLQDAGGWATASMRDRYRRTKQRNAAKVIELRQAVKK